MKRRILSLLLAVFMLFSIHPFYAFADEEEYTDSSLEEKLEKEDEINNDGSSVKEFSNLDNSYFKSDKNIALYADVSAIGYDINMQGGSDTRFPKENIADGDTQTKFGTFKSALTGYVTLKFSGKEKFNKIVLSESSLSIREYTIYTSNDGISWEKLADIEGMNGIKEDVKYYFDKSKSKDLTWQNIMDVENTISNLYSIHYFDETEAQYVKIEVTKLVNQQSNTAWGFYINEIGVYNEPEIDYKRFDIAYEKAADYYNIASLSPYDYDAAKLEKLKNLIESYGNVKNESYTQIELEDIADSLVIARVDLYRSRKYSDEDFDKIRKNVIAQLNVNRDYTEESDITSRTSDINAGIRASEIMLKTDTSLLWDDFGTFENAKYTQTPVIIQKTYSRIRQMALAATGNYSPYKGDSTLLDNISYALKKADEYWYNPDIPWFDSSMWSQMLGTPPVYSDTLLILKGYLPDDEIEYYAKRLSLQMKNDYMNWSGVNRMNIALANAKVGVILKEYWRIDNLRESVEEEFSYVDKTKANQNFYVGNGYYSDGTFIYHNDTPYNGGYGQDGMAYNVNGIVALNDSPWELPNDKLISYFVEIIKEGYDPIVVNGYSMSMMMGRNITRSRMERKKACELARTIAMVIDIIEEPHKTEFKSMIKSWFVNGQDWQSSINSDVRAILRDESVPVREPLFLNKVYHYGDRIVHRRGAWSMGISMSSSRIKMYEGINNENKKGWYTGSGVTYLYNNDESYYDNDYWYTVDMGRLPGITVEKVSRSTARYQGEVTTPYDTVGGVSLNKTYGAAQMELYQWESDLKARKSWFMFDDEVVCIGSGINSVSDNSVETVVENRMIDDNSSVTVNGIPVSESISKLSNTKTAHINGRNNSNTGYYFPDGVTLNVLKDTRTHKVDEVTDSDLGRDEENITRTFSTMYINHGKAPEDEKYAYVLLPDKTKEETESYALSSDVVILANEKDYHAVKEKNLGITAISLFENKEINVNGIHISDKGTYIICEKDGVIEFALSDTTQKNDDIITVTLDRKGISTVSKDENVDVSFDKDKITLKFDMSAAKGEEVSVKLTTDGKKSTVILPETKDSEDFEGAALLEGAKYLKNDKAASFNVQSASYLGKTENEILNNGSTPIVLRTNSGAEIVTGGFIPPVHKTGEGAVTDSSKADYYKVTNLTSYFKLFTDSANSHFYYYDIPEFMQNGIYFRLNKSWAGTRNNLSFPTQNPETTEALTFKINKTATVYYIYQGASESGVATNAKWLNTDGWTKCDETVSYVNGSTGAVSKYLIYKKEYTVEDGQTKDVKIGGQKGCYLPPQVFVVLSGDNREYLYTELKKETSGDKTNNFLALKTRKYAPESASVPASLQITKDVRTLTKDEAFFQIDYSVRMKDNEVLRQLNPKYIDGGNEKFSNMLVSFQPGETQEITIGTRKTKIGNYELDKWHKVSIVFDVENSEAHVYVDSNKLTSEENYLTIPGTPFENNISTLYFTQATKNLGQDNNSFYESHFDNFIIKTPGTPSVKSTELESQDRKFLMPEFNITFSNDIGKSEDKKIKLREQGKEDYIGINVERTGSDSFNVKPADNLLMDTSYELIIDGAEDYYGNVYNKTYTFMTIEADYEQQIKDALSFAVLNIPEYITEDMVMEYTGENGVNIKIVSDNKEVISDNGKIKRNNADYEVSLTVSGSKKGRTVSEVVTVTVPKLNITSGAEVTSDIENGEFITDDIPLTAWIINGSEPSGEFTLSFTPKNDFNSIELLITAPANTTYKIIDNDTSEVVKEATLSGGVTEEKLVIDCDAFSSKKLKVSFKKEASEPLKVYSMLLYKDSQADIDLDLKELNLGDVSSVTEDIAFNFKGGRNTLISWSTNNQNVIAKDGTVTRPVNGDITVQITATVTKADMEGLEAKSKTFDITVKKSNVVKPVTGGGGGGSFSSGSSSASSQTPEAADKKEENKAEFLDVPENHWAKDYIYTLKDAGIIKGINDTHFAPDSSVTREQFVKMLIMASGLKEDDAKLDFSDVDKNEWYYESLSIAYSNGIISGYDGKAGIGENITRQDMAVMVLRVFDKLDIDLEKYRETIVFRDRDKISGYAENAVNLLCETGILNGYEDGEFKPQKTLTRAESAKIICVILKNINKI